MILRQIISILIGGGLVSALNLLVLFIALDLVGSKDFSQVVITLALFFGCIDLFNSGSSKILIREEFLAYKEKIIKIDVFLSFFSFIAFTFSFIFFKKIIGFEIEFSILQLLIIFFIFVIYSGTQFHLGYLRYIGRNHMVSVSLLIIPLVRLILIFIYPYFFALEFFILLWISVEILPSLLYLAISNKDGHISIKSKSSWNKFIELYKPYFTSNWMSNVIYSFTKHFDVIVFSYLFSAGFTVYYKAAKSVYNIAFNLGGSIVVYLFRNIKFDIYKLRLLLFIIFLSLFMVFPISFGLIIDMGGNYAEGLADFNVNNVIFFMCLGYVLFLPTIITRLMHYKIQSLKPAFFTFMSLIDATCLFLVMVFFYHIPNMNHFISAIYITPFFSVVSLLIFTYITRRISNEAPL